MEPKFPNYLQILWLQNNSKKYPLVLARKRDLSSQWESSNQILSSNKTHSQEKYCLDRNKKVKLI